MLFTPKQVSLVLLLGAVAGCFGDEVARTSSPPAAAVLLIDPVQHDFGVVDVGQAARKAFIVKNDSAVDVSSLESRFAGDGFRLSNDGCSGIVLAPRATCSLEIEYAPRVFGESSAAFEIGVSDRATAKATLRGLARDTVLLTVVKAGEGTVTGTGIDCGADCTEAFARTTSSPSVVLTATAAPNKFFAGWSGAGCAGLAPTCEVAMQGAQTVTATFTDKVPLAFTLAQGFGATTSAASTPPGIACPGGCANVIALYDPGTSVTINVTSTDAYRFFGDCTGTTCTLTMTTAMTVALHTTGYNYGFTSSVEYNGNLGGLAGADAKCNQLATTAKLPGTFKAWLSTSAVDAKSRLTAAGGWIRTDGKIIATSRAELLGPNRVRNPMWLDEQKASVLFDAGGERFWTGTSANGVPILGSLCSDWTTAASGNGVIGVAETTVNWTNQNASPCDAAERLLCFGDDLSRAVPLPAIVNERRAFVSTAPVAANSGVLAMDDLCQTEASAAALPNAAAFKALIAPSNGVSAASRIVNQSGAKWVRVDGVELGKTAALYLAGQFETANDSQANGSLAVVQVATGYRRNANETVPFTSLGTHTCGGWSSSDAATAVGIGATYGAGSIVSGGILTADLGYTCDLPRRIYCFED